MKIALYVASAILVIFSILAGLNSLDRLSERSKAIDRFERDSARAEKSIAAAKTATDYNEQVRLSQKATRDTDALSGSGRQVEDFTTFAIISGSASLVSLLLGLGLFVLARRRKTGANLAEAASSS